MDNEFKCDDCEHKDVSSNHIPCNCCKAKNKWVKSTELKHMDNLQELNTLLLNKMTLQQNDLIDKVIEKVVYILYDHDIRLYNPQETIRQIKTILEREGI